MVKKLLERLRRRLSPRGYNLVMLAMTLTVMNVMVAAAIPTWTSIVQRDKEAELIFRGLQYAEAIRVFQQRFGRLPVRLEELIEVNPRCLRQEWENPMTDDGHWGLLMQAAPGGAPGQQGGQTGQPGQQGPGGTIRVDTANDTEVRGPIRGVYSPEGGDSFRTFFSSGTVSEWNFSLDLLVPGQQTTPGGDPNPPDVAAAAAINADDIGRPLPQGVAPIGGQPGFPGQPGPGQPGSGQPGGQPGTGQPGGGQTGGRG